MKLLLDTHIWLWSLLEPTKLSRRVLRELESKKNELWLSPISIWELLILHERGRVVLKENIVTWVGKATTTVPLHEAPITHEIALETRTIRLPHQHPADRFLSATAKVFELTLVTADERLMGVKDCKVLANR